MRSHTEAAAAAVAGGRDRPCAARTLYARAAGAEATLPGGSLVVEMRAELRSAAAGLDGEDPDALAGAVTAWAREESARYRNLAGEVRDAGTRAVLARRAALACAPLGVLSGAWLQWMSAPGNADDPATLQVLTVYADDVGVGRPRAARGSAYLALLRHLELSEHAVPAANLTLDQRIADGAFRLPALLLGMSRRPDDFAPEILGADLCLRAAGLPPPLALVAAAHPAGADWGALDPGTARQPGAPAPAAQIRAAIDGAAGTGTDGVIERATVGCAWTLAALRAWSAQVLGDLRAACDPAHEMAELLRLRAREGAVYHHGFALEGRPLSAWLTDCAADPSPLMEVLARSRLVKPGRADASALVTGLIAERGPMYRVFSPEDVTVIRRWIDSLPSGGGAAAGAARLAVAPALDLPSLESAPEQGRTPTDLRDAYHLLQTRQGTVALRRYALAYVRGWLRRARHGIDGGELPLPARWGPGGLRPWLVGQHDRHGQEFEDGRDVAVPSREALIESTVQLAPLTLIDGSWLQGFTDYEQAASEIGHFLFETYWDELGNGEPRINHPRLYREVLDEMDVHLPPTASPEFARWPGFEDRSFELPVFWLCIGRFPLAFMPEVLGLNLAMELSGVGGTYRRAHIALKAYGFSTRFVDIHNTIDNVATGHSAWAADAVDTYMTSLPATQAAGGRDAVWERVRTGYRALNPPDNFRARYAGRLVQRRSLR